MKIYISATHRDLQRHRQAVANVLRRMGHQPIGMEDYVAGGVRPLDRCLKDVTECDAYPGIVAWRYGFVPKDAGAAAGKLPQGTDVGRTSITEFEFRQAVESRKPVLMFLLDPEADWPSTQFDALSGDPALGKAVANFRQEVSETYLVSYFRTPEDLASLASAAVYRVEMDRHVKLESIRIDAKLNESFIRNGPVHDSTLMEITNVIVGPRDLQALEINIGQGLDWWSTRLYFLASLAADLTTIEVVAFVGEARELVGIVHPRVIKERLAYTYPVLKAYEDALLQPVPLGRTLAEEVDRRARIWMAQMSSGGGEEHLRVFVNWRELER